uniref:Uncharacterized protein n=1 Tax=Zea mays TaxID=4577 RepID=A0A804Q406_MAIZE
PEDEERPRRPDGLRQRQERLRHGQVGHPVGGGRRAATHAAVPQRVDLRVDDPRHRAHAGGEEDDVERQAQQRQPAVPARAPAGVPQPALAVARVAHRVVGHQARAREEPAGARRAEAALA